jgi:hypothetical protein
VSCPPPSPPPTTPGVEVLVVADACAGADDDSHAKALYVLGLYRPLVRVATVDEVLAQSRPAPR